VSAPTRCTPVPRRQAEPARVIASVRLVARATPAVLAVVPARLRDLLELAVHETDLRDVVVNATSTAGEVSLLVRVPMTTPDLLDALVATLVHVRAAVQGVCAELGAELILQEESMGARWSGQGDTF